MPERSGVRTWLGSPWWHWAASFLGAFTLLVAYAFLGPARGATSPGATTLLLTSLAGALLVLGGWALAVGCYRFVRGLRPSHGGTLSR